MREGRAGRNDDVTVARRRRSIARRFVPIRLFPLSQVHVKVSVPKGIKFIGHPGKHHLTRKKCVAPREATPTSIVLSFTELGSANITGSQVRFVKCILPPSVQQRTSNPPKTRGS